MTFHHAMKRHVMNRMMIKPYDVFTNCFRA
jgi:hypothetical protein